ncbi:HAMP domain-containing protein [Actinoplanes sp. TBRC 11911]|uniref:sensor histidine kinase n=1 Tax=Actinoplanes sp. TBRC 11911 TaxID=2729386 RepID=UPI00145DCE9F|nr:CHASE3 domain-containing protein [Actinoplanes sp. TBRC 11911]NMO57846.1 HAMP domain-containing protein [Actinoplanes sp. TBRC 11911]
MRRGLTFRTVAAGSALVLLVGICFLILAESVQRLRVTGQRSDYARQVVLAVSAMRSDVSDLEAGLRGYVQTRNTDMLAPYASARARFPQDAAALARLCAPNADEAALASSIIEDTQDYIADYGATLIQSAQHGDASVRNSTVTDDGVQRINVLNNELDRLTSLDRARAVARNEAATRAANTAQITMTFVIGISVLLIVGFTVYLARVVVMPVRRAATMAGRLAGGALDTRLPVSGAGEVGDLQQALNVMAGSLEESRDALTASRARIVASADEARRRVERDLHDGAQQRLVSLSLELRLAQMADPPDVEQMRAALGRAAAEVTEVVDDLREMAQGIHPAILTEGGLGPALRTLAHRSPVPVEIEMVTHERFPAMVEAGAYYIAAEALANTAKHAKASSVRVQVDRGDESLVLTVQDDGCGGADYARGSGLVGLRDRAEALGGTLRVSSPVGEGTRITARLPVHLLSRGS